LKKWYGFGRVYRIGSGASAPNAFNGRKLPIAVGYFNLPQHSGIRDSLDKPDLSQPHRASRVSERGMVIDLQSGESEEEEVTGEGIGDSNGSPCQRLGVCVNVSVAVRMCSVFKLMKKEKYSPLELMHEAFNSFF